MEGHLPYQGRSWIRFGISINQEVSRSHSTKHETSCIEEYGGLTSLGRAERYLVSEFDKEAKSYGFLALS